MKKYLCLSLLLLGNIMLSLESCEIFDPSKDIPSYLHLDSIRVNTTIAEGSNSSKITDAWVYIDQNLQGTYELPCTFPVLTSGKHSIDIRAGILMNGLSSVRSAYPFYTIYSGSTELISGKKQLVGNNGVISVNYTPQTIFALNEDFEKTGFKFTISQDSQQMNATTVPQEVFEGKASAKVMLNAANPGFLAVSDPLKIPTDGSPVALEINSRNECAFDLALRINTGGGIRDEGIGGVLARSDWGKVYFQLEDILNTLTSVKEVQLIILATKPEALSTSALYFDNIKVLHR